MLAKYCLWYDANSFIHSCNMLVSSLSCAKYVQSQYILGQIVRLLHTDTISTQSKSVLRTFIKVEILYRKASYSLSIKPNPIYLWVTKQQITTIEREMDVDAMCWNTMLYKQKFKKVWLIYNHKTDATYLNVVFTDILLEYYQFGKRW